MHVAAITTFACSLMILSEERPEYDPYFDSLWHIFPELLSYVPITLNPVSTMIISVRKMGMHKNYRFDF
jgi:hypothetical protein